MKQLKKSALALAIVMVLSFALAPIASASSVGKNFSWAFGYPSEIQSVTAYKSDANDSTGDHASVRITGYSGNGSMKFAVFTVYGQRVTNYRYFNGTGLYELPYNVSVTNGNLILKGECTSGSCGFSGVFYP